MKINVLLIKPAKSTSPLSRLVQNGVNVSFLK